MASNGGRPIGELTRELSEQTAVLIRKEISLASAEMREKGRHASFGAGLLGAAGTAAWFGFGALVATAILVLAEFMDAWLAAAIVSALLFASAGVAARLGQREAERVESPLPEQAAGSVADDFEAMRRAAQR